MYVHVYPNPPPGTRYARLQEFLVHAGEPPYRLRQLLRGVHDRGVRDFADLSELPTRLRRQLAAEFGPTLTALERVASQRGPQVEKVLFQSRQGARIETVLAKYRADWTSLCVSTQVGCGLGCAFCASGAVGLVRNLDTDEICDQVLHFAPVDSIAFMGMGEALANPHTFPALELLTGRDFHSISPRRLTVSTVGFAPGMRRLVAEHPQVNLTLSVHSPYEEERAELVPLQNRFPLAECLGILDDHVVASRRKTYLAYLLIDGINDTAAHARALAALVRARRRPGLFHVSVIPYNDAAGVSDRFRRPRPAAVDDFLAILRSGGVRATRRQQFGGDLDAACGQLHARYLSGQSGETATRPPGRRTSLDITER